MPWRQKSPYQLTPEEAVKRAQDLDLRWILGRYEIGVVGTDELMQAIVNAERERRERRLWAIALASAIASVISAVAAWTAILVGKS